MAARCVSHGLGAPICRSSLDIEIRSHYHDSVLVCHCLRVFDGEIRECVRTGARSVDDVSDRCGAGSACGGCRDSIETIVERESASRCPQLVMLTVLQPKAA
jgi:bacterioferritin-associated ferredoxin